MSLSSAGVSPRRARDAAGPRVVIAGGRLARLKTLLTLRALTAEGVEITMPAPDRKFTKPSLFAAQAFDPQRAARRLADTASALGARCDPRMLDRFEQAGHRARLRILGPTRRGLRTGATGTAGAASLPVESASTATS